MKAGEDLVLLIVIKKEEVLPGNKKEAVVRAIVVVGVEVEVKVQKERKNRFQVPLVKRDDQLEWMKIDLVDLK